uniref:Uncharacterized protein n=1 Tax=Anguilla anguilla TaxID=7936 RepID=A0A0E9P9I2_ANGAN
MMFGYNCKEFKNQTAEAT